MPRSCQSRSRRQQLIPEPQPISCGSISQGIPLLQNEDNARETCPVRQPRPSALGLRLRNWDKRFDQFPQPVRQEFDRHWTTSFRKNGPSLSPGCRRNEVLLDVLKVQLATWLCSV